MSEQGLISRHVFPIDQGRVVVDERWDLDVPGCPIVRPPFGTLQSGPHFVRQIVMTPREYNARFPNSLSTSDNADRS